MCGRYYIEPDEDDLRFRAALDELNRRALAGPVKTQGEVFPSDTVPVLALSRDRRPSAFAMRWGYTLDGKKLLINARSERAAQSPLFREGFLGHRCVVPASNYFEWRRDGKKAVKYAIAPAACGALYMAGIYRLEGQRPVFAILTRPASDSVAFIHDRMPVILSGDLADQWMIPQTDPEAVVAAALQDMRCAPAEPEDGQLRMPLD